MACPFAAGAYCWVNGEQVGHTPVAVLESLVVLQTMAAEPWRAPVASVQTLCLELGLHRSNQVLLGRWWERCWCYLLTGPMTDRIGEWEASRSFWESVLWWPSG